MKIYEWQAVLTTSHLGSDFAATRWRFCDFWIIVKSKRSENLTAKCDPINMFIHFIPYPFCTKESLLPYIIKAYVTTLRKIRLKFDLSRSPKPNLNFDDKFWSIDRMIVLLSFFFVLYKYGRHAPRRAAPTNRALLKTGVTNRFGSNFLTRATAVDILIAAAAITAVV